MAKPSTFDLLRWSDIPDSSPLRTPVRVSATNDSKAFAAACDESSRDAPTGSATPSNRKPAGGPCTFAFGEQISTDEAEALLKRKPLSETKKKEISGNKLFSDDPNGTPSTPERVAGGKLVQPPSQITFGDEVGTVSPKKTVHTPSGAARHRDLGGSHETVDDVLWRRASSVSKNKELVGNNIFAGEVPPPSPGRSHNTNNTTDKETPGLLAEIGSAGRSNTPERRRSSTLKTAELSGNNIFKEDEPSQDKRLSIAKLSEMNGSNIFSDGKPPASRDSLGGVRKPPGGESTIALV